MSFELSIKNLSKQYETKKVLTSVHCLYSSGLIHGVAGANGSGKTTFFNCITRNLAFEGEINYPQNKKTGYLPAELFMYPRITGLEFIRFCLNAKELPLDEAKIVSLNRIFELPLNEYAETYSTGMLKKLYLFVLVLERNDILILDEPFNGLDVNAVNYITEILLRLRNSGSLILISSHIIDHLYAFCDTLSYLANGQIHFAGSREQFGEIENRIKSDMHYESLLSAFFA